MTITQNLNLNKDNFIFITIVTYKVMTYYKKNCQNHLPTLYYNNKYEVPYKQILHFQKGIIDELSIFKKA